MIYFIGRAQTNIINICFFTLIVINGMILAKNDDKDSTLLWAGRISKTLNFYAMAIIIIEFIFAITIGFRESVFPESNDQQYKKMNPTIYKNFQIIGLRMFEALDKEPYSK